MNVVKISFSDRGIIISQIYALKLIEYLTGENAQKLYINTSHEYPVNPLVEPSNIVKKWGDFKRDSLDLNLLGKYREDAIKIFDKTGWK